MGKLMDRYRMGTIIIFSFIYSVLLAAGYAVYKAGTVSYLVSGAGRTLISMACIIMLTLMLTVFSVCMYMLWSRLRNKRMTEEIHIKGVRSFLTIWVFMILCYLPCYLSYFPGIWSYDAPWVHLQVIGLAPYSNYQPVLHTLLWGCCYGIERMTGIYGMGLAVYSVLQISVITAVSAYSILWMAERKMPAWICLAAAAYYALAPNLVLFALMPTKDVLFSACFMMWVMLTADMLSGIRDISLNRKISAAAVGVIMCLLRNNGVYVVLVWLVLYVLVMLPRRKADSTVIATMSATVLIYLITAGVIYPACKVEGAPRKEALSVPMSQMAAVYCNKDSGLTDSEKKEILYYIPRADLYNPRFADPIKSDFNEGAIEQDESAFIRTWLSLGIKHPVQYTDAFLTLNLPYWYPGDDFPDMYSQRDYIETYIYGETRYHPAQAGLLPRVRAFYDSVAAYKCRLMRVPLAGRVFSLSMPFWFMCICLTGITVRKRRREFWAFLPGLLLFGTYLLGPVSNFRYLYTFELLLPVCFTLTDSRDKALL